MPAYFCTETGIRIVAPGVHKSVDTANGHEACLEVDGEIKVLAPEKPGSDDTKKNARKGAKDDGAMTASASVATPEKPGSDK